VIKEAFHQQHLKGKKLRESSIPSAVADFANACKYLC